MVGTLVGDKKITILIMFTQSPKEKKYEHIERSLSDGLYLRRVSHSHTVDPTDTEPCGDIITVITEWWKLTKVNAHCRGGRGYFSTAIFFFNFSKMIYGKKFV